uniref:Extensin-like n=1 Tax=Cicer arietinum TaxID=3827 RepID=A0A1S3EHE5_CICAR|nr:extensin-like [Cicer arietinum]
MVSNLLSLLMLFLAALILVPQGLADVSSQISKTPIPKPPNYNKKGAIYESHISWLRFNPVSKYIPKGSLPPVASGPTTPPTHTPKPKHNPTPPTPKRNPEPSTSNRNSKPPTPKRTSRKRPFK